MKMKNKLAEILSVFFDDPRNPSLLGLLLVASMILIAIASSIVLALCIVMFFIDFTLIAVIIFAMIIATAIAITWATMAKKRPAK